MDIVIQNICLSLLMEKEIDVLINTVTTYRISVSKERWGKLEGTSLQPMHDRVVFYLEGPSFGIDLLIKSAPITCSNPSKNEVIILFNHFCSFGKKAEHI